MVDYKMFMLIPISCAIKLRFNLVVKIVIFFQTTYIIYKKNASHSK